MLGRSFSLYLVFIVMLAVEAGCKKSESEQKPGQSPQSQAQPFTNSAPGDLIARVHWLGKKRLATDINAAPFMGIWNMPESEKLERQTLDKLALAPWDLPRSGTNLAAIIATNTSSALLRPLLDDLLQEESYLEIRQSTNQPDQGVLAIRLDDQRAALWKTNVAAISQALATNHLLPVSNLALSRDGQWTLLAFGEGPNALVQNMSGRIQYNGAPFAASLTNYWIDTQFDLKRLMGAGTNGVAWPTNINLTVIGDGKNVLTRGEIEFAQSLPIELEPWIVPTNLIHDPLIGFSAIRGFRPFLKSFKPWNDLQLGTPPNQAYTFVQRGTPWMHFAIIPSAEASTQVDRLSDIVVRDVNPKLASTRLGAFEKVPGTQHLRWQGVPIFAPDLNWTNVDGNSYILGGFYSHPLTNQPAPPEMFAQFNNSTNVIWYDWEFTKGCIDGWTPISQVVRHMLNLPRLDADPIAWLTATGARLGNSVSVLKLEGPTELSFVRQSTSGFTAPELPLLADWLESPKFPNGLHTFLAPPPAPPIPPQTNTNAPRQPPTNAPSPEPKKP